MPKHNILIATKNPHKAAELTAIFADLSDSFISLKEWEECHQPLEEPAETGADFAANAVLKARYYAQAAGLCALADDSGLSVDALGGAPGVFSARHGGPGLTDRDRLNLILKQMEGIMNRGAHFTSVLALARPDGAAIYWEGRLYGLITRRPSGENGFGYDPIFYLPFGLKTLAEMTAGEKNGISHRALAAAAFKADQARARRFLAAWPSE